MGDRQEGRTSTECLEPARGAAVEQQPRRTAAAHDFDRPPQHLGRVAGPERLHSGFFRREPAGEVHLWMAPAPAVGDLALSEDAVHEPVAVT